MAKRTRKSAAVTESHRDSRIGRELDGRYRIEEQLGAGGVGAVYRATQLALGRPVAIKILHEGVHPSFIARFEREAKALAALRHPNIVAVTDYGVCEGTPFLVMELLEGETLHYRLAQGQLPPERVLELTRQMLRAVQFVHEQGLVHRDLKPGNLFLEKMPDGERRLKLLDFGLAKFVQDQAAGGEGEAVTRAGDIVGTPAYIAPEQVAGDKVDVRADTYAVGVMLFQMLANRVPYEGEPVEQLKAHLVSPVPSLAATRKDLSPRPELEALLARAMAKQREARFQSCNEMLAALEAIPTPWFAKDDRKRPDPALESTLLGPVEQAAQPAAPPRRSTPSPSTQTIVRRVRLIGPIVLSLLSLGVLALGAALLANADRKNAAPAAAEQPAATQSKPAVESSRVAAVKRQPAEEQEPVLAAAAPPAAAPEQAASTEAASEPSEEAAAEEEEDEVPAVVIALPEAEKPPARNPWMRATPKALAQLRKAVAAGERGNDRTVAMLRKYNRQNPQDARGHLLLAQLYRNRSWRDDTLNQYTIAYQIDPSSRGAPEMLRDLIKFVVEGPAAERAAILIRHAYGHEALGAISRAAAGLGGNGPALARIAALRAAISGS